MGRMAYGPGGQYTIDTNRPFTVRTTFHGSSLEAQARFNGLTTRLQQGSREVLMDHSRCGGYLETMASALAQGMSMRITYWGDSAKTMGWLDRPPCSEEKCSGSNAGAAVISNITVSSTTTAGARLPGPGPSSGDLGHVPTEWEEPSSEVPMPWWVFLFIWISVVQTCLLCVLGIFTVHLLQQMSRPAQHAGSPPWSRRFSLPGSQGPIYGIERPPAFERTRSAMLMVGSPLGIVHRNEV